MKPLVQKLPLNAHTSFVAKTFTSPHFEVPWHQHIEYELILFTQGNGMSFIGNYVGEFKTNDIFFIGSQVPHTFQKQYDGMVGSAVVVQFTDDFWGKAFLALPESNELKELFMLSIKGIRIEGEAKAQLAALIVALETATGFLRIGILCDCLQLILDEKDKITLSTGQMNLVNTKDKQRLDDTIQYTIKHFQQPITLAAIAKVANMSVTAFCAYFKKSTKKQYISFLNEVRIGYACTQLQETDKPIIDICYDSGFNTAVNFNKQFLKIKGTTPSQFRSNFGKHII
ncbi:AraC family transcriptional regulator [Parasediminibacterium sp. JCM 36343]|uniref:AraC family transcriptional regulator n=1 Tax=Parasediminibacterium sp. JCM 36343 TaxID=3374279 RepID=UPI00397D315B